MVAVVRAVVAVIVAVVTVMADVTAVMVMVTEVMVMVMVVVVMMDVRVDVRAVALRGVRAVRARLQPLVVAKVLNAPSAVRRSWRRARCG